MDLFLTLIITTIIITATCMHPPLQKETLIFLHPLQINRSFPSRSSTFSLNQHRHDPEQHSPSSHGASLLN